MIAAVNRKRDDTIHFGCGFINCVGAHTVGHVHKYSDVFRVSSRQALCQCVLDTAGRTQLPPATSPAHPVGTEGQLYVGVTPTVLQYINYAP